MSLFFKKIIFFSILIILLFYINFKFDNSKYDLNQSEYPREGNEINFHTYKYKKINCDLLNNHISFLIFGQSNAANSLKLNWTKNNNFINLMFFNNKCYELDDKTLGSTGVYFSLWKKFAQEINISLNTNAIILNKSIDGTSIEQWSKDDMHILSFMIDEIKNYENKFNKPLDFIVLILGETDGFLKTSKQDYITKLNDTLNSIYLASNYKKKPFILMSNTSGCYNKTNLDILDAQIEFAKLNSNVSIFMNTDNIGMEFRYDGCHYNQKGASIIINSLVRKVLELHDSN